MHMNNIWPSVPGAQIIYLCNQLKRELNCDNKSMQTLLVQDEYKVSRVNSLSFKGLVRITSYLLQAKYT